MLRGASYTFLYILLVEKLGVNFGFAHPKACGIVGVRNPVA